MANSMQVVPIHYLKMWQILAVLLVFLTVGLAKTCDDYASTGLPCVEVPRCDNVGSKAEITVNKLSNGLGGSKSYSTISMCFDDSNLYVTNTAMKQMYFSNPGYKNCNDPVFNADVSEMFVAPNMEPTTHCYNELDISPFNVMYDAGIYSPNLNHSGVVGTEFNCDGTGINYKAVVDTKGNSWTSTMSYSFALLNCPNNCPLRQYCGHTFVNEVYRANFFRVNELVETSKCSSSTCEYMAWSPTNCNPPAFHEPTKFGYLLMQL